MMLPRHAELWLPGYVLHRWRASIPRNRAAPRRVWVTICDHFEPFWKNRDEKLALTRVLLWRKLWPEIAKRHCDANGRQAQYNFFYPEEDYRAKLLHLLAEIRSEDVGDVELHIHHDQDTAPAFLERVGRFRDLLYERHGLLRQNDGRIVFGFIHGNWALDNSDGGQWCGLNNEITLLRDLGCYADFTMPAPRSQAQARVVNEIYWAVDDPDRPKSYDTGVIVEPGKAISGDLLMIPGPLGPRWGEWRFPPRIETGELASHNPVTEYRVRLWMHLAPRIGDNLFIKLYAHGAQERASQYLLLERGLSDLFRLLEAECQRRGAELRYATAWEMRLAVDQAARGSESLSGTLS